MRTKHARTVARSATASMTALRSRTSRPALSAASAAMQATWLATVPTDRGARTGATMVPVAGPWHGLVLVLVLALEARPTPNTR